MNPPDQPLFLLGMHFDARRLYVGARDRRLPLRDIDLGYLIHCHLADLFGEEAPKPFAILDEEARDIQVLGYSAVPAETLRVRAQRFASPDKFAGCEWERFAARPVPATWKESQRVGFSLRACPIQRMSGAGPTWKQGAEVDVFLVECWKAGAGVPVEREKVYVEWLRRQFDSIGGVRLDFARLVAFQRERLFRRAAGGPGPRIERPVGRFEGELTVTDPLAFMAMLRRGIGRHRSFGFGMLLLRPAGKQAC